MPATFFRPLEQMTTREMWDEYNRLVPHARARGHRRFRVNRSIWHCPRHWAEDRMRDIRQVVGHEVLLTSTTPAPAIDPAATTFGVELEFLLPAGQTSAGIEEQLRARGVDVRSEVYGHSTRNHWKIVTDGSLRDYRRGREIVSPVLSGEGGLAQVRIVCEVLTAAGCKINKECGLHVHVGARGRSLGFFRTLVQMYQRFEVAIDGFMSASRRGSANMYCGSMSRVANVDGVASMDDLRLQLRSRYVKLNLQSYWRHGTVEFRHHQGTVDPIKATMWVRLCLAMAAAASTEVSLQGSSLEDLFDLVSADADVRSFYNQRSAHFARRDARRMAA